MEDKKSMTLLEVRDELNIVCSMLAVASEAAANPEMTNNPFLADTLDAISKKIGELGVRVEEIDRDTTISGDAAFE